MVPVYNYGAVLCTMPSKTQSIIMPESGLYLLMFHPTLKNSHHAPLGCVRLLFSITWYKVVAQILKLSTQALLDTRWWIVDEAYTTELAIIIWNKSATNYEKISSTLFVKSKTKLGVRLPCL